MLDWQKAIDRRLNHIRYVETDSDPLDIGAAVLRQCAGSSTEDSWIDLLEGMAQVLEDKAAKYWDNYDPGPLTQEEVTSGASERERFEVMRKNLP